MKQVYQMKNGGKMYSKNITSYINKLSIKYSNMVKFAEELNKDDDIAFAVFAVVEVDGGLAATTRPKEGGIGLPGGKVDPGETEEDALYREAEEEGWKLFGQPIFIHEDYINEKLIRWYKVPSAEKLEKYKESHRLVPIVASKEEIANSGYGNSFIKNIKL